MNTSIHICYIVALHKAKKRAHFVINALDKAAGSPTGSVGCPFPNAVCQPYASFTRSSFKVPFKMSPFPPMVARVCSLYLSSVAKCQFSNQEIGRTLQRRNKIPWHTIGTSGRLMDHRAKCLSIELAGVRTAERAAHSMSL